MKQKSYRLEDLKNVKICIGYAGENKHTQVRIDCSSAFAEYPGATPALAIRPPRGGIYPAVIDQDGDTVVWTVTNGDLLFKGDGELQFSFIRGEVIEKTFIGRFEVLRSIITTANTPDGVAEWLIRAVAAAAAAEAAARHQPMIGLDGYWYKWDSEAEEYVNTGTKAQGPQGEPGAPGDPTQLIDDVTPALNKTFSSSKVDDELTSVKSEIQELPNNEESTDHNADLDVSDEAGNVILRLENGHIKTKNFNSEDQNETRNSSELNADFDISDEAGNVLMRLENGHIKTKYFDSSANSDPIIITVKNPGGDFTTVRGAIEAAQQAGASASKPFIIQIAPGTYDLLSEFTSEEIAENSFKGLFITDGITLEGMGILRDQTVLYAEMDTTTYDSTKRNNVATLNFNGNVGLKNLTVISKNMRYAVHDDSSFSSTKPKVRTCENCVFRAFNTTSGGGGNISYGAGTDSRKVFIFKDCDFGDMIHIHTDDGGYADEAFLYNCRAYGFTATDYNANVDHHYYFYGCTFNYVAVSKGSNWTAQHLFLHGDLKGAMVHGWSGMQYELGDCMRYQNPDVSTYPIAVAMKNTGRQRIEPADTADETIGVCLFYDSTNDFAIVQHSGWLSAEYLGFVSPQIGDYLVVGTDGALTLESSNTGAIGRVVCENNAGKHFIKLSI